MQSRATSSMEEEALSLAKQGKYKEAEDIYKDLVKSGTRNYINYERLAAILGIKNSWQELLDIMNFAIKLKPDAPNAHLYIGIAYQEQGETTKAITHYKNAIMLNPNNDEAHIKLASAYRAKGDTTAAITHLKTALELNSNNSDIHYCLGNILLEQGDIDNAIKSFYRALAVQPNLPGACNNLAVALIKQGDLNAAICHFNQALKLRPNYPDALYNLGNAYYKQGNLNSAIKFLSEALAQQPNYPEAQNDLGLALLEQGWLDAAIESLNKALTIQPNYPEAHYNLGLAYYRNGELDAAIQSYYKALELRPNYHEVNWDLSLALLHQGSFELGWKYYEWRFMQCQNAPPVALNVQPKCQRWQGERLMKDEKLLLVSEQGLGDTLQFMRYALHLKTQGNKILLSAPYSLHRLIQVSGIDPNPLSPEQANKITEGKWIPLLSVPRLLEINHENPIITSPYIFTSDNLMAKWRKILSQERHPIIGINFQGNPTTEIRNLKGRSLPLEAFAPITKNLNASLLSLQKGFGSEQLNNCSFRHHFVSCQELVNETWDFLETAAIIANCDLVITSDTCVAHLAGGMGKKTWLLLKKEADWRWGMKGDASFWYPSMRLFRQWERGNWITLLEVVADELKNYFRLTN